MTVNEAKNANTKLEIEIGILIDEFNEQTGCTVQSIKFEYIISYDKTRYLIKEVTIKSIV